MLVFSTQICEQCINSDKDLPQNDDIYLSVFIVFFQGFAGLVQLGFRGAIHPRIMVGPPVPCSSTFDDPIYGGAGRLGIRTQGYTLQQPDALSSGPCPTPI
jgi:hypothetical protein